MEKSAFVNMVKEAFRSSLKEAGISEQEFAKSERGIEIVEQANKIVKSAEIPLKDFFRQFVGMAAERPGTTAGLAAVGGAMAGLGTGATAATLTSPPDASIAVLQKKELIQEYDNAIEELQRRIRFGKARGAL